ncbi:tail fiber domain-containing protein [Ensifer sp. ENS07]|uniref:tail fiber domain-containing protein n=1 Tax=Ensifer sp. ENS07 TaxID=2769274 RepID=UPI001786E659|nr:tail fiber domain-containing protein [Ensifer sp. ENS07]MBD9635482.1 tail fiber domain-containing protein [Ensifer sp. ENS07]
MADTANTVYRDFVTDGVPASGNNKPKKREIRALLTGYETIINAFISDGGLIYTSKASLDADLAHGAHASAWVIGDATAANNGVCMKVGASGAGSWVRVSDLPFSFIIASDAGAGTPNAIQATTSIPVSCSALVWLNVFEVNTSSPVTVAFNGEAPLTIKTNSGSDVLAGELLAGMIVLGIVSGATFRLLSDHASAAIVAQAQSYANAAAAAANAGFVFDTESDFESANVPVSLLFIQTSGYHAPGDGGGHLKKRISTPSLIKSWHKQSADGAWWEVSEIESRPQIFGARGDSVTDDTAAAQSAQAYAKEFRLPVVWGRGRFVLSGTIEFPAGVPQIGAGAGEWLAWSSTLPKVPALTELIFIGTGPKSFSLPLVTDMRTSGGVIANPSPISGDTKDTHYRLTSFMNDAGTPRQFSCAVKTERSGRGISVRGMRIVLNHPGVGETYGIQGYNDNANQALGSDWDVGFWNESGQALIAEDVHVVGYWRMYGGLQTAVIDNDDATSGAGKTGSEYSRYLYCNFQGAVGWGIRGGDSYKITEVGANYVGIEDAPNLPFKAASNGRVRLGSSETSSSAFTYTAVTVVGGNLRLTITESLGGISVGGVVVANVYGFGISNTVLQDCELSGLSHATGKRATQLNTPFNKPSAALEGSGAFIRGLTLRGSKLIGLEDVLWHFHNIADVTMDSQTVVEPKVDSLTSTVGARCIASPTPSVNTRVTNPMGQTDSLRMDFITSQTNAAVDLRPRTSLSAPARFAGGGDAGFFEPQSMRWLDQAMRLDRTNVILQARSGGSILLRDAGGTSRITVTNDGATTTVNGGGSAVNLLAGFFRPTVDNAVACGSTGFRWTQLFAATATIGTSDEREKQQIEAVRDVFLDAWGDVDFVQFKFNDAVERKGDAARLHCGVLAQRVEAAFRAHGLDPFELGVLCWDEWEEQQAVYEEVSKPLIDEDGKTVLDNYGNQVLRIENVLVQPYQAAGNRYGIRYEEALVLEAAYQRRRVDRIEERLVALGF